MRRLAIGLSVGAAACTSFASTSAVDADAGGSSSSTTSSSSGGDDSGAHVDVDVPPAEPALVQSAFRQSASTFRVDAEYEKPLVPGNTVLIAIAGGPLPFSVRIGDNTFAKRIGTNDNLQPRLTVWSATATEARTAVQITYTELPVPPAIVLTEWSGIVSQGGAVDEKTAASSSLEAKAGPVTADAGGLAFGVVGAVGTQPDGAFGYTHIRSGTVGSLSIEAAYVLPTTVADPSVTFRLKSSAQWSALLLVLPKRAQ